MDSHSGARAAGAMVGLRVEPRPCPLRAAHGARIRHALWGSVRPRQGFPNRPAFGRRLRTAGPPSCIRAQQRRWRRRRRRQARRPLKKSWRASGGWAEAGSGANRIGGVGAGISAARSAVAVAAGGGGGGGGKPGGHRRRPGGSRLGGSRARRGQEGGRRLLRGGDICGAGLHPGPPCAMVAAAHRGQHSGGGGGGAAGSAASAVAARRCDD